MVRVADQVVGHHRDLAAAAGRVDDVGRHRVPGGVAASPSMISRPLPTGVRKCPESFDEVALVEVVGPDPVRDELVDERALDVDAVDYAGEQHALVPDGQPGLRQLVDGAADLGRDLIRMVEVQVDPQRVVLLQHLAQLVVDALRQEDRHPRADAGSISMCGISRRPRRIDSNSLGASVSPSPPEMRTSRTCGVRRRYSSCASWSRRLKFCVASPTIRDRVQYRQYEAHWVVTSISTRSGYRWTRPGTGEWAILGERVLHHRGEGLLLAPDRDDLPTDRVRRVGGVDEADEVRRDVDAELVGRRQALALLLGQFEDLLDLLEVVDPVAQLPAPVVPLRIGDVGPDRSAAADGRSSVRPQRQRGIGAVDERCLGQGAFGVLMRRGGLDLLGVQRGRASGCGYVGAIDA